MCCQTVAESLLNVACSAVGAGKRDDRCGLRPRARHAGAESWPFADCTLAVESSGGSFVDGGGGIREVGGVYPNNEASLLGREPLLRKTRGVSSERADTRPMSRTLATPDGQASWPFSWLYRYEISSGNPASTSAIS